MLLNEKRTVELMERSGIDTLIASSPENIVYTTEFWSVSQWVLRAQIFAVMSRERNIEPIIVAPMSDMDLAVETSPLQDDVVQYGQYYYTIGKQLSKQDKQLATRAAHIGSKQSPVEVLTQTITERGLDHGAIGLDEGGITPADFGYLKEHLPKANLLTAANVFREIRMVKTIEEIQRLREAVEITENAMLAAVAIAREGVTEREMAREFESMLARNDAAPLLTCIGFSDHAAHPNVLPSDRKLKSGDIVRFDIGCRYRHYCSDIARTFVFGEATAKHKRYYSALVEGEEKALDSIKAGSKANEVFDAAVGAVRKAGIENYARHHCGHGVGLEPYDMPPISGDSKTLLQEGMVLCIETPYMELGFAGLQVEDEVLVLEDGYKLLSKTDRELKALG